MKLAKKLVASALGFCLINWGLCHNTHAFMGNTNYYIGKQALQCGEFSLPAKYQKAFLSGMVYGDIGWFELDKKVKLKNKKPIRSDSPEFTDLVFKHASTPEEKWFAAGLIAHSRQETLTLDSLDSIFDSLPQKVLNLLPAGVRAGYFRRVFKYGVLENYFQVKTGRLVSNSYLEKQSTSQTDTFFTNNKVVAQVLNILSPALRSVIDISGGIKGYFKPCAKELVVLYPEPLIKAYDELGIKVSKKELRKQASISIVAFALAGALANRHLPSNAAEKLSEEIEAQILGVAKKCAAELQKLDLPL